MKVGLSQYFDFMLFEIALFVKYIIVRLLS
jgi:hypothetical protein